MMAFSPCTTPIYLRRRKSEVREVAGKSLFLVRPCSTKSAVVRFGPRDDVLNIGQSPAGKVAAGVRWRHDLGRVFHHFDSAKGREHTSPLTHTVPVEFSSKTSKEIPGVGYIVGKNQPYIGLHQQLIQSRPRTALPLLLLQEPRGSS